MNKYRNEDGMINLEQIINRAGILKLLSLIGFAPNHFNFKFNNEVYYFKQEINDNNIYNELIASEIAKDFGIEQVLYDYAYIGSMYGVISKSFIKNDDVVTSIKEILSNCYETQENHANLQDIYAAFYMYYGDNTIAKKLYDELVKVYMFDVLISNRDRLNNIGVIMSDGVEFRITPVYDNEYMLNDTNVLSGSYKLKVTSNSSDIELYDLFTIDNGIHLNEFKSKLWVISEENLNKIYKRIENEKNMTLPLTLKEKYIKNFKENSEVLNEYIHEYESTNRLSLRNK